MQATPGEFELIDQHLRSVGASRTDVALGVGDDAALLTPAPDITLCVASAWALCERDTEALAKRLLAQAQHTLAANGATPAWATLSLTLPAPDPTWLAAFSRALHRVLANAGIALVGGDTTGGSNMVMLELIGTKS